MRVGSDIFGVPFIQKILQNCLNGLNELKFCEVSRFERKFFFKQILKISAIYLEKQKQIIPKKILFLKAVVSYRVYHIELVQTKWL